MTATETEQHDKIVTNHSDLYSVHTTYYLQNIVRNWITSMY